MAAIQHKAGSGCWCKEKHTNLQAMRLNTRDLPPHTAPLKWGAKKRPRKRPKGKT
jgi:hypothetical protein